LLNCNPHVFLRVTQVGALRKRERLFILAIREGDELADPARLLWHPVERWEPDRIAAAMADAEGQRQ
jgi:DNA (cytosine-5)-methyltransferase 1